MPYRLNQWEAIQIFCEIIAKGAGKELDMFKGSNNKIIDQLEKYRSKPAAIEFAQLHKFNGDADLLYKIGKAIREGMPLNLTERNLRIIKGFIGKEMNFTKSPNFELSSKQRIFEESHWWLYYEEEESPAQSGQIGRAILSLQPFGKAEITRPFTEDPSIQTYIGHYFVYGKSQEYLKLDFKTKLDSRDLHILIQIGEGIPEISVGAYDNITKNRIICGTVLIEKIHNKAALNAIKKGRQSSLAKPIVKKSTEYGDLPKVITMFFDKLTGLINIPNNKNSISELADWLNKL